VTHAAVALITVAIAMHFEGTIFSMRNKVLYMSGEQEDKIRFIHFLSGKQNCNTSLMGNSLCAWMLSKSVSCSENLAKCRQNTCSSSKTLRDAAGSSLSTWTKLNLAVELGSRTAD
jgi:hypothetical protein